jgi:hypothetical protein
MLNQSVIPELQIEAANTRKMLERVPQDQFQSKPHDKPCPLFVWQLTLPNYHHGLQ